jgi:4-amino-4-deoxy-L-arabinose transferase-like glycosyltransferase
MDAADHQTQSPQARWPWPVCMTLVLTLAGVLFFARLSERALWSEEMRWAQIPREMQQCGNYLWPTINGHTYYDKPLGSYWLVLLASFVTGGVNEASARLPSALAGLAAVAFAMLIARRLYDEATAILAGIILATSFSFVFFARNASTDAETVAGVLAACWIYLRNETTPTGSWTLLLWLVMALTSLTKGLLGFVLPILIIGLYATLASSLPRSIGAVIERNRWLFNRWSLAAIPLGVGVYLAPFVMSMAAGGSSDGLEMVYRENIRRFFDPVNHRGPVYLYGYVIFLLLAPWSLLLPAALVHAHTSDDRQSRGRAFALAYFWGTFLFFTLSSSRRSYYLLPVLPAAAFLIARLLADRETLGRAAVLLLRGGFLLGGLMTLVSAATFLPASWFLPEPISHLPPLPCPVAFGCAWAVSVAAIAHTFVRFEPRRIGMCFGVMAVTAMAYFYLFALPATEAYRTQKPFADAVKEHVGSARQQLAIYNARDIVYYLDALAPLTEYHTSTELRAGTADQAVRWLIVRRRDWENSNRMGTVLIEETVQPWDDTETTKNKLLLVEIGNGP